MSAEARQWLTTMLGETCAIGPHWWPQEAEEWILELFNNPSTVAGRERLA